MAKVDRDARDALAEAILERCSRRSLLRHFALANFFSAAEFLGAFAAKFELAAPRLLAGGATDARPAALGFIRHLSQGRMPFCTAAPAGAAAASTAAR